MMPPRCRRLRLWDLCILSRPRRCWWNSSLPTLDAARICVKKRLTTVRAILRNVHVTVLPQTHESFMKRLDFYASRTDKAYSLVDCISMNTMRQMNLTEVLTNDHHFTQEGFTILIKR
jgi:predicted nucleic acid-binding protein